MAKHLVVGFGFYQPEAYVVLIKKNKPPWQDGFHNGVGGKVEEGERFEEAMAREFAEETSVETDASQWKRVIQLYEDDVVVHFFVTELTWKQATTVMTNEDEPVSLVPLDKINHVNWNVVPNLRWMIPLARHVWFEKSEQYHLPIICSITESVGRG